MDLSDLAVASVAYLLINYNKVNMRTHCYKNFPLAVLTYIVFLFQILKDKKFLINLIIIIGIVHKPIICEQY